ncbi:hypothetical protein UlMin_023581 [Ulmus minor]
MEEALRGQVANSSPPLISAGFLGGATAAWVFFELLEYHLLTLVCYILIGALAIFFLYCNAHTFINKHPPSIRIVHILEDPFLQVVSRLTIEINQGFVVLHEIASGKELKKFLIVFIIHFEFSFLSLFVIASLWILSIVGSWCNFVTLFYIAIVLLHMVPLLYEKYEDKVDPFAEKAWIETKKQYVVFDAKVLSKIPKGPLKGKKTA